MDLSKLLSSSDAHCSEGMFKSYINFFSSEVVWSKRNSLVWEIIQCQASEVGLADRAGSRGGACGGRPGPQW